MQSTKSKTKYNTLLIFPSSIRQVCKRAKKALFGARFEIVMEAEMEERTKPIAIFKAFGTRGDVYPIAVRLSLRSFFFRLLCNFLVKNRNRAFLSFLTPRILIFSLLFSTTKQRVILVQVYKQLDLEKIDKSREITLSYLFIYFYFLQYCGFGLAVSKHAILKIVISKCRQ